MDALDLHGTVPVRRGGHRAGMRAEADQARLFAIMFAAQLADVQFLANAAHFGKPRIADMAVVRPDDGFGLRRSGEPKSELPSLMRMCYAIFCLKTNKVSRTEHQSIQYSTS